MNKLVAGVFYIWVAMIPISLRWIVYDFIPGWHEYETIFLYINDLVLLVWLILSFIAFKKTRTVFLKPNKKKLVLGGVLLGITSILASQSPLPWLATYKIFKIIFYVMSASVVMQLIKKRIISIQGIVLALVGSALFEAVIGILQFKEQKSIGFMLLGEPRLGFDLPGVAKVPVAGTAMVRGYGTFLHPNILATFLVAGMWGVSFYYTQANRFKKIGWLLLLFIIALGLVISFSRSAWLALGVVLGLIGVWSLIRKDKKNCKTVIVVLLAFGFAFSSLMPITYSRVRVSPSEPAVRERLDYNEVGIHLLRNKPLGVGPGNQVFLTQVEKVYEKFGMEEVWLWQPIHNTYLLIATEVGVIGGAILLVLLFGILKNIFIFLIKPLPSYNVWLMAPFLSCLVIGFFDHFFWTISNGMQILLISLILVINTTQESAAYKNRD